MRLINFSFKIFVILLLLSQFSCSEKKADVSNTKVAGSFAKADNTFNGWNSVILLNSFTQLDIVPELGGKIMGYSAFGNQILWHNPSREGEVEIFQQYDFDEEFVNPGGAKVWPAPQNKWGGPPDKVLDGSPYEYIVEDNSVTITSPQDNESGRTGIQYTHSYSLVPKSSIVDLNLSMKNISSNPINWALWHLSTVPVGQNYTVYVPVEKDSDWEVMYGQENDAQWLGVEDGLFRARFDKGVGKVGMKVREGWAAYHDDVNELAFVIQYPMEKAGSNEEYPHGGHNFEIWSTGEVKDSDDVVAPEMSHMELEVLGPLTELAPNESTSLNVKWAVCKSSGIKRVTPFGVISEEIKYEDGVFTGKFGVFHTATLELESLDKNRERSGRMRITGVSPLTEFTLDKEWSPVGNVAFVRFILVDSDRNIIGVLADFEI